jgi:hypothetical protein
MPIFQDDIADGRSSTPPSRSDFEAQEPPQAVLIMRRKVSEESIRTELCEGPISDSPPGHDMTAPHDMKIEISPEPSKGVSDRVELIERLKKGESPTWLHSRYVRL